MDQKKIYGVARGEVVSINCSVSANPGQDLVFRWTFNNTSELANIQDTRFSQNGTVSRLIYSPYHELDYGTILCWAANHLGEQEDPCTYHIIPAGKSSILLEEKSLQLLHHKKKNSYRIMPCCFFVASTFRLKKFMVIKTH